jgi:hypothetical protein
MKTPTLKWAGAILLPALVLALASCSTNKNSGDVNEVITAVETPDGAIIVDTVTATAQVTAIDQAKRKITLAFPGGGTRTYKVGPQVVNFPQIQVGDQVKARVTEEAAVYVGKGGPPSELVGAGVALAPVGDMPAAEMVDTRQVTAKIIAVDAPHHKITLEFADGGTRAVKLGKKVDLSTVHVGDDVTAQLSEGLALSVEKP